MHLMEQLCHKNYFHTSWNIILIILVVAIDVIPGRSTPSHHSYAKDINLSVEVTPNRHFKSTETIGSHFVKSNETNTSG